MTESSQLHVEAAEYAPFGEARLVVEVSGRWVQAPPVPSGETALLIVDGNGLVHRFAEISAGLDETQAGDEYLGSFVVPAQFRRRIATPTALRAGGVTVTVPGAVLASGGTSTAPATPAAPAAPATPATPAAPAAPVIAALREDLEQAQAELRAAVAELTARLQDDDAQRLALETSNAALEAANASLSAEVASLRAAVEQAQAEIVRVAAERDAAVSELGERYAELAGMKVSQETALEEVDELRRELERGEAELAEVREQFGTSEVEEAELLLAETRALTAKLINRGGESHA
jgi:hypothetical protein